MVFIVKIPNRSRANTPEASNTPSNETPPPRDSYTDAQTPPLPTSSKDGFLHAGGAATHSEGGSASSRAQNAGAAAAPPKPQAAELDVLLAPSVLNHRYVRGVDKSLIVERPERIRAVLLGIATAIGKSGSDQQPPVPVSGSTYGSQSLPAQAQTSSSQYTASTASTATARQTTGTSALPPVPSINTPTLDDDDLVARLSSLSVHSSAAPQPSPAQPQQKFRVLHSTRSLQLDPPHPAVAFTHAHSGELVTVVESAYDQAKQKRREARATTSPSSSSSTSATQQLSTNQVRSEREATPTPSSIATLQQQQQQQRTEAFASTSSSASQTSHAAYLEYLCNRAPNHPPASQIKSHHSSPSKSIPEDSEAYTSSDGEGDEAMHLSEVPEHLPQGDLYLAGPSKEGGMDGGSAEAIRHAMGACCEAVDRVVSAASASSTKSPSTLREIKYDGISAPEATTTSGTTGHVDLPPPPAKRAFVLSRPPGHHCSGSTPQGFCWVNNAIVASAHAYLEHSIDRIVIFDIDLHHGNGTQNLAWRINADANRHDDARTERLASLRAAALDRARQALGTGTGRAHASRLAKVTLSERDEEEAQNKAGPRALRLFYSSLHDIESFPCEDGDPGMIKDASTCVEGAHGQWIWNVHLDHYRNESEFSRLYEEKYSILFRKASRFLTSTSASPQSTLILISAGFDACSYEYPGMQRHGKHVPPSFYHTFARDSVRFADLHSQGKLISVLEGGYSDRALCSAALAHVSGLAVSSFPTEEGPEEEKEKEKEEEWWKLENLIAVEKVAKKMAAHAAAAAAVMEGGGSANTTPKRRQAELAPWLMRVSRAFAAFERACGKIGVMALDASASARGGRAGASSTGASAVNSPATVVGASGRVLRDRGARGTRAAFEAGSTPGRRPVSPTKATPTRKKESPSKKVSPSKAAAAAAGVAIAKGQGGPFADASTPIKSEIKEEGEEVLMDTDTPTRSTAVPVTTSQVTTPTVPGPSTNSNHPIPAHHVQSPISDPVSVPAPPITQPPHPTFHQTYPVTSSSTPSSPPLTATPVTLVDAMSPPTHQIVDANTPYLTADPLGLDSLLGGQTFHFSNGNGSGDAESEEDAVGSPDPDVLNLDCSGAGEREEYFPPMQKIGSESERERLPGGLGTAFAALNLQNATHIGRLGVSPGRHNEHQQTQHQSNEARTPLYPSLPNPHFPNHHHQQQQQRHQP